MPDPPWLWYLGLALPVTCAFGILATERLPDVVRGVQIGERLGCDTAGITDAHLVCRELWVTLAACATATSRIRLGPGGTVPHSRHVSVTASALATLHDLAPGRVVIGVGTGGSSAQTMGLSLAQVGKAATLGLTAVALRRLLHGDTVRFETGIDGRLAWLDGPRAIPIYLAGSGPRVLETAGRPRGGAVRLPPLSPHTPAAAPQRAALAGTSDDVAAQVARLRGVAGLTRVIAFPQAPGAGFAAREEILTMFADAVLRCQA